MRDVQSVRDRMGNAAIPRAKVATPWPCRAAVTDQNVQRLLRVIDDQQQIIDAQQRTIEYLQGRPRG